MQTKTKNIAIKEANTQSLYDGYDKINGTNSILGNDGVKGVEFSLNTQSKDLLILRHWKDNEQFLTQWALIGKKERKLGQRVSSTHPLHIHNTRIENAIKKQANQILRESEITEIIQEIGEFLSNHHKIFFPTKNKFELKGESKKNKHLKRIAVEIETLHNIIRDEITKELYIYNQEKGVYELHDTLSFNRILQDEYGGKFFKEDVEKVISTFTREKKVNKRFIAFKNCLLDLDTMKVQAHDPQIFCTFQIPFNYNQKATSPFFKETLKEILCDDTGDEKLRLFLQIVGYSMTNDNKHNRFFLITGPGKNGKSTLLSLFKGLFGDAVTSVSLTDFNKPFGLQPLIKSKVNILFDLPIKNLGDTGVLKGITGEDTITIDRKFKEPITTKITAKIIGAGNSLPTTDDLSDAFLRRLIHIELKNRFEIPKPGLAKKLLKDNQGMEWLIFRAIEEYKKVESNGWVLEPTVEQNRDEYLKKSNPHLYAAEQLFELAENEHVTRNEAYKIMCDFLEAEGIKANKVRTNYFKALEQIGAEGASEERWKDSERVLTGIRLKQQKS